MVKGLILEGIASAGKSTILKQLRSHPRFLKLVSKISVFEEEQTLGELVTELRDSTISDLDRCYRLQPLLKKARAAIENGDFVIFERFHHSYYALMPNLNLVKKIDEDFAAAGFVCAFLDFPSSDVEKRFLYRSEMQNDGWTEDLISWYGSKEAAIQAFLDSQANRLKLLNLSLIPTIKLNTQKKDWEEYSDRIVDFLVTTK